MNASTNSSFAVRLYKLIRSKTDEKTAKEAVSAVEGIIDNKIKQLPTKDDLREEIRKAKEDLIKWFVGMFVTLALMIIGLYIRK